MKENLEETVNWILKDEGGFTTAHGLGGATNYGITLGFLSEVRKKQGKPAPTVQELKNLTKEEAKSIYANYVLPLVEFNKLSTGLDYAMANLATMDGPTGARKIMQKALGLEPDGIWGPKTWEAIEEANPSQLSAKVLLYQLRRKMDDPRIKKHGPGWANRSITAWDRVCSLINKDMK